MAFLHFSGVGITAMAACVPLREVDNLSYSEYYSAADVKKIVQKTGIRKRRFADACTCASDLCCAAAERLIADNAIDRSEIDLLVFISQTPDYHMPSTSTLLQERLGLPWSTITFDLNMGCSGFLHGLSTIYAYMERQGLRKALLLIGETASKVYSPKDRRVAFLFGDAGAAALIERGEQFGDSWFSIQSDGSRGDLIMVKGGGYRNPSSVETLREKVIDSNGNISSDEQGYMRGAEVFNFVIEEVPRDIRSLLQHAGMDMDKPDYYVLHQANQFINSYIARKMKFDLQRVPSTIAKYGNTSSVSVPLTIVSELQQQLANGKKTLLMTAFGVGMTWGSAIVPFCDCRISDIVEY